MITFFLLLFAAPLAIYFLGSLLGAVSVTLGLLTWVMGWCAIASVILGPWVFVVGLLLVIFLRINYNPSKEN